MITAPHEFPVREYRIAHFGTAGSGIFRNAKLDLVYFGLYCTSLGVMVKYLFYYSANSVPSLPPFPSIVTWLKLLLDVLMMY